MPPKPKLKPAAPTQGMTVANVSLPTSTLTLLKRVALARSIREGGRASVSAVIVSLVEARRAELEKEAKS